jgi:hypothetical protein
LRDNFNSYFVNAIPTTPVFNAGSCGVGSVVLKAASAGTINWYAAGGVLGTGSSFTTPVLSATTPYWVDATSNIVLQVLECKLSPQLVLVLSK